MAESARPQSRRQMIMRDVLRLPSLEGAEVLAGNSGLDREVTNAMVMEGPDIEKWGRPGLVLVTSLFALIPLDPNERLEFFDKVAGIGIAGIIYKPGRTPVELLQPSLAACEARSIPFVQMKSTVNFEAVLMDVMGTVIDSNAQLLDSFYETHRKTMRLALKQPSIYEVVSQLKERMGCEVSFFNKIDDAHVGTENNVCNFESMELSEFRYQRYQTNRYYNATLRYSDSHSERALAVNIPSQSISSCYLVVHTTPEDVSAFQRMTIDNYVNLLSIELLKQEALNQQLYNRNNMLVHDLLHGRYISNSEVDGAIEELGIGTHALYQVMLLRVSVSDPSQTERMRDLLRTFQRRIHRLYPNSVFFESNNRLSFIRNHTSGSIGFDDREITTILNGMHNDDSQPHFSHLLLLSSNVGRYDIPEANAEVLSVYKLFDADQLANRCVKYEDLGLLKFLIDIGDSSKLASYIDSRVSRLRRESPEGFQTLVTLCKCECSYSAAASQLFVHPKTVRYRIERIRNEYGIDVHNSDDLMQVLLTEKIVMLLGPNWKPLAD